MCGAVFCLNALLAFDIQSHWISSFLFDPSPLSLPSPSDAYKICEKRADWQRARYPLTKNAYQTQKDVPWMNSDQWMESLLRGMGVNDRRRPPGFLGLGLYFGDMEPSTFETLGNNVDYKLRKS
ncbi:hypothetical protein BDY24DRAFT_419351 [Mrakia frigida]|uniref:uncharacterized protein n=1 Tax=Mrakia frigida TaxID=29902 RepID=UPI003FCC1E36